MTGPRNKETPWKSAATLEAELRQVKADRDRAVEALRAAEEMFVWLQKHYPKALDELPTPIYQRIRFWA